MIREDWLNTSVEDLRATLHCAEVNDTLSLDDVTDTAKAASERNLMTKGAMLRRCANRMRDAAKRRQEIDGHIENAKHERCGCGHLRFNHAGEYPVFGHGGCLEYGCDCERFTFAELLDGHPIKKRTKPRINADKNS